MIGKSGPILGKSGQNSWPKVAKMSKSRLKGLRAKKQCFQIAYLDEKYF
jgi:hypothetical protein